jgi:acetyl-CoA synthetase
MSSEKYRIKSLSEYQKAYQESVENPEQFWSKIAEEFVWHKKWDKVLDWNFSEPKIEWFAGGKLNITENCLDRWVKTQPNKPAIIWEPNDPNEAHITLTYKELHHKVNQFAQVLLNNGAKKGDRICIYMPMVPELVIAVLACARIGAIHSVVFGGFSAHSLTDRINDAQCSLVITADGAYRGSKEIPLKDIMDEALRTSPSVTKVIVLARTQMSIPLVDGRDVRWEDEIARVEAQGNPFVTPASMDAEDMLFILYTSGSTGKPKGVVHTCGGYMVWTNYTFVNVFQPTPDSIHFCTADIGWITGHSYIVYGPLSAGATSVLFEGIPTYPDAGRFWDIVEKHKISILYTAPTAIRSLMAHGLEPLEGKNLDTLKVLGTVGEPINEEAWHWYNDNVGKGKCPVVDTWWQTETAGILISNLAGVTPSKPTYATLPLPGVQPILLDEYGQEILENNVNGNLCIKAPWPGILRTTYGDHDRCKLNYFSTFKDLYFTGDGCFRDDQGQYRITGRVDDVLNVSGHRIGTAEIENAINMHFGVVESAVVGYPHDIKGQGIYAFVIYNGTEQEMEMVLAAILQTVTKVIGAIAKPDKIQLVSGLPKTRSGKIMRRILRKVAEGEIDNIGDVTTLLDPNIVEEIKTGRL